MTFKALGATAAVAGTATAVVAVVVGSSLSQASTTTVGSHGAIAKTPSPKHGSKMRLIKSGGELTLTKEQQGRQEPMPPPAETKSPRKPKSDSKIHTPASSEQLVPRRLGGRGGCGLPTDEMLAGGEVCDVELPEEEEVQPTPSVAVRTRLPRPEDVSWGRVLTETKDVAFPGLRVKVQPVGRTLVNLETIVYTDEAKVSSTTVTLLGFPVEVEATPMSYTWRFGDGSAVTTHSPGKPYPAKEITHKYMKRGAVSVTLTTNYAARFNVDGSGWQYIAGTVPITGPATPLQVQEAVPVLVDPPN